MAIIQRLVNLQFNGAPAVQITGTPLTQNQVTSLQNFSASVSGLRVSARITVHGLPAMSMANVRVWGMPQDQMNQLSTLGMDLQIVETRSKVTITAGDLVNGMYQIYQGTVLNAWADYQAAPQVPFNIECADSMSIAVMATPATSINGAGDAAGMISQLASAGGYSFANNGVNVKIKYPYWWGSVRDQMLAIVDAANIEGDTSNNQIAIWPKSGFRDSSNVVLSPGNGLIGYPAFINAGVSVKTLFNPQLKYGSQVTIQGSSVTPANGVWKITNLEHELDSMLPNGKWFSTLQLYSPKVVPTAGAISATPSPPSS